MVLKIIFALVALTLITFGTAWFTLTTVRKDCVPLGYPCTSISQCCDMNNVGRIELYSRPTTCFIFGDSKCRPIDEIKKYTEFFELRIKLNHTNFQELKQKYWAIVKAVKNRQ